MAFFKQTHPLHLMSTLRKPLSPFTLEDQPYRFFSNNFKFFKPVVIHRYETKKIRTRESSHTSPAAIKKSSDLHLINRILDQIYTGNLGPWIIEIQSYDALSS